MLQPGDEVYYFGIIDILQVYNAKKKLEVSDWVFEGLVLLLIIFVRLALWQVSVS